MKEVYVVFAVETDGHVDGDDGLAWCYAIGATEEIAQAIINKDVEDGQIYDNAFIQKMKVTQSLEEV